MNSFHRAFRWVFPLMVVWLVSLVGQTGAAEGEPNWARVVDERRWSFPRDHGAHPEYRTEWWYFTGNLVGPQGDKYGFQLTFFRQGMAYRPVPPENAWSVRDVYLAHFSLTDGSDRRFQSAELASRAGPGLAGASESSLQVWVLNWSAQMKGETIFLEARKDGMELQLQLQPRKPLVFQGSNGVSRKGPGWGQASFYVSYTNLATQGLIRTRSGGPRIRVKGVSWFDHEFGSNQLSPDQAGWDWFSLHLSDGRDLMFYLLRRKDGSLEGASSGTLVESGGSFRHLTLADFEVLILDRWRSPRSNGVYPSRWRIRVPSGRIDLLLVPLVPDQELDTIGTTGVIYWEGAVEGKGVSERGEISAQGYIELTGYAGTLGGVF